jgi:hypothetical protein
MWKWQWRRTVQVNGMAKPTRNWLRTNSVSSSGSQTPKRGSRIVMPAAPGLPGIGRSVLYSACHAV